MRLGSPQPTENAQATLDGLCEKPASFLQSVASTLQLQAGAEAEGSTTSPHTAYGIRRDSHPRALVGCDRKSTRSPAHTVSHGRPSTLLATSSGVSLDQKLKVAERL